MESNTNSTASYRALHDSTGSYDEEADNASGIYFESTASVSSTNHRSDEQSCVFTLPDRPCLNRRNYVNLFTYIINLSVFLAVGAFGSHGLTREDNVLKKYETLITPAQWNQLIWAPIFSLEGIFVVVQMLPEFRARPMVQGGVKFWFSYLNLGQIAWSCFFFFGQFLLSFLSICFVLFSLISLMVTQFWLRQSRQSRREYWLLRFPFSIHIGWIFSITAVNFGMVLLDFGGSGGSQLSIAIVSLSVLLLVAVFFIAIIEKPDFGVPAVIIWTYFGIAAQLTSPSDEIKERFGSIVTEGVCSASFWCAGILLCLYIPRLLYILCHQHFTISVVQH